MYRPSLLMGAGLLALGTLMGGCTPQETQMFADSMLIETRPAPEPYVMRPAGGGYFDSRYPDSGEYDDEDYGEPPMVPGVVDNPIYNNPRFSDGYYHYER